MSDLFTNRVVEMKVMKAGDLLVHDGNPFVAATYQREALQGDLEEIGIVDALKAYYSERNGGKLTLLDGHKRQALHPEQMWPVIILDIDDDEADVQITLHNTIGMWQAIDPVKMQALIERARVQNKQLAAAKERIAATIAEHVEMAKRAAGDPAAKPKPEKNFKLDGLDASVKVVVHVGDGLDVVERAIRKVGVENRGQALLTICRFYLDEGK